MIPSDMEKLARTVARETVNETFLALGVNTADPVSVQGQFAFLRNLYYGTRKARDVAITAFLGMAVTGIGWAIWAAVKAPAAATAVQLVH